jgi:hypothetical protein
MKAHSGHTNLTLKEEILARTISPEGKLVRFKPDDELMTFLSSVVATKAMPGETSQGTRGDSLIIGSRRFGSPLTRDSPDFGIVPATPAPR